MGFFPADLLNSYDNPLFTIILNRYSLFPEKLGDRLYFCVMPMMRTRAKQKYVTIYLAIHVHLKV